MIETDNLILRRPVAADFDSWAALDADEAAARFIGGVKTREAAWLGFAATIGMWSLRGCGLFSVVENADGRWIGRVGPWIPEGAPGTEIGWALSSSEWGKGRATEAASAAVDWAFNHLGWSEVIHCIHAENLASIAVSRKLGAAFSRVGQDAAGETVRIYAQSREQWLSRIR
jgi:RimJ/RimL family protein N-acetyltransferase